MGERSSEGAHTAVYVAAFLGVLLTLIYVVWLGVMLAFESATGAVFNSALLLAPSLMLTALLLAVGMTAGRGLGRELVATAISMAVVALLLDGGYAFVTWDFVVKCTRDESELQQPVGVWSCDNEYSAAWFAAAASVLWLVQGLIALIALVVILWRDFPSQIVVDRGYDSSLTTTSPLMGTQSGAPAQFPLKSLFK